MIGRKEPPKVVEGQAPPKGFDDFDLRLGDVMRGERATMGKSLLDVQRELKIKASFIAAIENADPTAFETPGFVAGYVRSYSRYLGTRSRMGLRDLLPRVQFCLRLPPRTSWHAARLQQAGLSQVEVSQVRRLRPLCRPNASPLPPNPTSPLANLEPRAIGSTLVLLALIGAVGFGGWSVLQEIQRVNVTPVERAPGGHRRGRPAGRCETPCRGWARSRSMWPWPMAPRSTGWTGFTVRRRSTYR